VIGRRATSTVASQQPGSSGRRRMRWAGEYRPHAHLSVRNGVNAVLCALALAPTLCVVRHPGVLALHPLAAVNLLFFVNVTVGFWALGLLQRSFWLIDPYWTILPPLIGAFYQCHPLAAPGCVHASTPV
jgi:hypothetical protein